MSDFAALGAEEPDESGRYPVAMHVRGNVDPEADQGRQHQETRRRRAQRRNAHGERGPIMLTLSLPKALLVCA